MDLAHWGLAAHPFRNATTPQQLTLSSGQQTAFRQINDAFQDGERIALLTGIHGAGKTVLAQHVVGAYESRGDFSTWAACVPVVGSQALYQMLLADLGQPFLLRSTVELRMQLIDHLLPIISDNKSVLVVVDEAQYLPLPILEELRPLIEIITPQGLPGVQLLLAGTSQLAEQLSDPGGFGLCAWIGCKTELQRLDVEASIEFLQKQWVNAGGRANTQATAEAWSMMAEMGGGLPRELNRLARHAFRLAEELEQDTLDAEAVWEAASDLGMQSETEAAVPLPVRGVLKESA